MSGPVRSQMDRDGRLTLPFAAAAENSAPRTRRAPVKRAAPFSIRLTAEERAALEAAAGGKALGAYVRSRILDNVPAKHQPAPRRPDEDHKALGRVLARLGQSELASSLEGLAKAAEMGALSLSPDVVAQLTVACNEVKAMRLDLMQALGLRQQGS